VLLNGKPRGVTDGAGRINMRIRERGIQTAVVSYRTPIDSEETDEIVRTATLQFTAPGRR